MKFILLAFFLSFICISRCKDYKLGPYTVSLENQIQLLMKNSKGKVLFSTYKNNSFLSLQFNDQKVEQQSGFFDLRDEIVRDCVLKNLTLFSHNSSQLVLYAQMCENACKVFLTFSLVEESERQVRFATKASGNCSQYNQVSLRYDSPPEERIFGFGRQYSLSDFKGKRLSLFSREKGAGRGMQPLTFYLNHFRNFEGGDPTTCKNSFIFAVFFLKKVASLRLLAALCHFPPEEFVSRER